MTAAPFTPTLFVMTGGLIVWAARFLLAYAFTAIGCAKGWAAQEIGGFGLLPLGVAAMSGAAVIACVLLLARAIPAGGRRAGDDAWALVRLGAGASAGLAMLAIVWETLPVLLVPACPP